MPLGVCGAGRSLARYRIGRGVCLEQRSANHAESDAVRVRGGTSTDRRVFFGLLSRRKRVSREPKLTHPAIAPTRHPIAMSVNTRLSNEMPPMWGTVLLFAIDVAAPGAGVDTTGIGVICSGAASAAAGAHPSAQHTHSICSESLRRRRPPEWRSHDPLPRFVCTESCAAPRTGGYCRIQVIPTSGIAVRNMTFVVETG